MIPGVSKPEDCQARCCAVAWCNAWDLDYDVQQCWIKSDASGPYPEDRYSGTVPPANNTVPPAALPGFDDSQWEEVQAPHDMLIVQAVNESNPSSQGFRPRNEGWYRKNFSVPANWANDTLWLYFEGAFHVTTAWLNGKQVGLPHVSGYTSFAYRLDNMSSMQYGTGVNNLIALHVDGTMGDGWWYEGAGLYRRVHLVRTSRAANLAVDGSGVFPSSFGVTTADGLSGSATLNVTTTVESQLTASSSGSIHLEMTLVTLAGEPVGQPFTSASQPAPTEGRPAVFRMQKQLDGLALWTVRSPSLYTLHTAVVDEASGAVLDAANRTFGFRSVNFTADQGLFINGQHVKGRGMCDHSNYASVGSAVPARVNLYRAQLLRTTGVNLWRMAHNPPVPARLDFTDRLGIMVLDETRNYGGTHQQGGDSIQTIPEQLDDMQAMITRDRHHASIIAWSQCNEVGCDASEGNFTLPYLWRRRVYKTDGTHPLTQNHLGGNVSTSYLDIQGFSHKDGSTFDHFHSQYPNKPTWATECCSSLSQRGVDEDTCPDPRPGSCTEGCRVDCHGKYTGNNTDGEFYNNEISQSLGTQVLRSDNRSYMVGTTAWSGFSYYGESRGYPQQAKQRGIVADVAGFEMESASYLRTWWLNAISTSDAGRPPLHEDTQYAVYFPETWVPGLGAAKGTGVRTIHVYSNCPAVELRLDGQVVGARQPMPAWGTVEFTGVTFKAGNLTAVGLSEAGDVMASFSRLTPGPPAAVRLSLDAPSPNTGTGSSLVLDGFDVAMVRAELVDNAGTLCRNASDVNITFSVESGPGTVIGTHNGDPSSSAPPHGTTHPAYHGLARAFVRAAVDATSPHRELLLDTQPHLATPTGRSARVVTKAQAESDPSLVSSIVVRASAPGLPDATLTIPTSTDPNDLPAPVAARSVRF